MSQATTGIVDGLGKLGLERMVTVSRVFEAMTKDEKAMVMELIGKASLEAAVVGMSEEDRSKMYSLAGRAMGRIIAGGTAPGQDDEFLRMVTSDTIAPAPAPAPVAQVAAQSQQVPGLTEPRRVSSRVRVGDKDRKVPGSVLSKANGFGVAEVKEFFEDRFIRGMKLRELEEKYGLTDRCHGASHGSYGSMMTKYLVNRWNVMAESYILRSGKGEKSSNSEGKKYKMYLRIAMVEATMARSGDRMDRIRKAMEKKAGRPLSNHGYHMRSLNRMADEWVVAHGNLDGFDSRSCCNCGISDGEALLTVRGPMGQEQVRNAYQMMGMQREFNREKRDFGGFESVDYLSDPK